MFSVSTILVSLFGFGVDLASLIPVFCTPDYSVCVAGSFAFSSEGSRVSIRTTRIDSPVSLSFPAPVFQADFYAHANPGEECEIPNVTFCGTNTYDGGSFCLTEFPLRRDANGCAYSTGAWSFGTPTHREFLIDFIEVVNLELWNLKVVPVP